MMFTHFFKFYNSCKGASSHSKHEEQAQNGATARNFLTIHAQAPHNEQISKQERIIRSQSGRSMVEMLGVLAIIGVLSVGGIAGYSKAMMKYKLNKQAGQISTLINAGLRYAGKWEFEESTNTTSFFIKLGEVPKEMIKDTNLENKYLKIYDVFNTMINYYSVSADGDKYTQFFMYLNTSKNDDYSLSICRNIVITVKEFHSNIRRLEILNSANDTNNWDGKAWWGDKYCTKDRTCLKDVTIAQIDTYCRHNANKSKDAHMKVYWDE